MEYTISYKDSINVFDACSLREHIKKILNEIYDCEDDEKNGKGRRFQELILKYVGESNDEGDDEGDDYGWTKRRSAENFTFLQAYFEYFDSQDIQMCINHLLVIEHLNNNYSVNVKLYNDISTFKKILFNLYPEEKEKINIGFKPFRYGFLL
jgi:hypothetical protein